MVVYYTEYIAYQIYSNNKDREIPFCNRFRMAGHWTGDCRRGW
jgi:hypothetical protein